LETWNLFDRKFRALWNLNYNGDLFSFCKTDDEKTAAQNTFLHELLSDTLGYAGVKIMRRIIGVAKVEDFKSIKDEAARAQCELKALKLGRALVLQRSTLDINNVIALAKEKN